MRNGTSTPPLTTTDASHNPESDCAATRDGSRETPSTTDAIVPSYLFVIFRLPAYHANARLARRRKQKTKSPGSETPPGPANGCDLNRAVFYLCTIPVDAARRRPEASPAQQHEHSQQRTTIIAA